MNFIKSLLNLLCRKNTLDSCSYLVKDAQSGEVIFSTTDEETAYRVALGKVRTELFELDNKARWKSLASFDREMICNGFKASYMNLKNEEKIIFPVIVEVVNVNR
jgi:hypothetical protein